MLDPSHKPIFLSSNKKKWIQLKGGAIYPVPCRGIFYSEIQPIQFPFTWRFLSQTNTNYGEEELIPDADKKDFGVYAMSHIHTSKWDVLIGLRTDNRKITTSSFDKNYNSFTSSLGFKRDFSENKIFRLNFSNGYRAPNLSELFSDGVHHGTAQYEIGDINLIEEKNFQTDISISSFDSGSSFGLDVFYKTYLNESNRPPLEA